MNSNRLLSLILACAFGALALLSPKAQAQTVTFNARATVAASSSGANTLIAGIAGTRIFVYGAIFAPATSVTLQLKSGSTALTGAMTAAAPVLLPVTQGAPYFVTAAGDDLVLTLGGGVATGGVVWYVQQ